MITFKNDKGIEVLLEDTMHSLRRCEGRNINQKTFSRLSYLAARAMLSGHEHGTYKKLAVNTKVKGRKCSIVVDNIKFDAIKRKITGVILTVIDGFTFNSDRVVNVAIK